MPGFVPVPPSPRRPRYRAGLVALVVFALIAVAGALYTMRPAQVRADGAQAHVPAGSLVADVRTMDLWSAPPGDLVGVDGSVLTTGAGEPPTLVINGRTAADSDRVYPGDTITSSPGSDRREALETTLVPMPFETEFKGKGSLTEVEQQGAEGLARVTRGAVSGAEVSSVVVKKPVNMVVARHRPKPGQKVVALTFDDGPWPGQTDKILDVLAENDAKATFFMLGVRVKKAPALAKRVADEGHMVANHSIGHRSLARSSAKEATRQITRGRSVIKKHTGVDSRWLRPPYGEMDKGAWKVARKTDSIVVMWTVDSEDWRKPGAKKLAKRVVKRAKPGSIILFHDGGGDRSQTVRALPIIIKDLRKKGYEFVTVDDLYGMHGK